MSTPNVLEIEARSYELDAYDHVNIAVYVNWLEHARLSYLRDRGTTYTKLVQERGFHIVVVSQSIAYKEQVRLGDRLTITTTVARVGNSSVRFHHEIAYEDGRVAAEADVTMVCVGAEGRSVPVPDDLRAALES
jgi:acyl-CoA thioester hydrolase